MAKSGGGGGRGDGLASYAREARSARREVLTQARRGAGLTPRRRRMSRELRSQERRAAAAARSGQRLLPGMTPSGVFGDISSV